MFSKKLKLRDNRTPENCTNLRYDNPKINYTFFYKNTSEGFTLEFHHIKNKTFQ